MELMVEDSWMGGRFIGRWGYSHGTDASNTIAAHRTPYKTYGTTKALYL